MAGLKEIQIRFNKDMSQEFNKLLREKVLSVFDDCFNCGKEARLLNGLCFDCWVESQAGVLY